MPLAYQYGGHSSADNHISIYEWPGGPPNQDHCFESGIRRDELLLQNEYPRPSGQDASFIWANGADYYAHFHMDATNGIVSRSG